MKKYTVPVTETTKAEPAWDFARSEYNNQSGGGIQNSKRGVMEEDDYYVYEILTGDEEEDGVW